MLDKKVVSQCISADYCRGWNDAVDAMPSLISVNDKLPPPLTDVLVILQYNEDTWNYKIAHIMRGQWHVSGNDVVHGVVTWWMPIPTKPERKKEE